jgi:hypothetical protein
VPVECCGPRPIDATSVVELLEMLQSMQLALALPVLSADTFGGIDAIQDETPGAALLTLVVIDGGLSAAG